MKVFRHVLEHCRENDAFMKNHALSEIYYCTVRQINLTQKKLKIFRISRFFCVTDIILAGLTTKNELNPKKALEALRGAHCRRY